MRYKVKGRIIRSENAAKPHNQASRVLIQWIESQPNLGQVLDFGCGKLRYFPYLISKATHLTLVDSEIQLNRIQQILGERTTVWEYAKTKWKNTSVIPAERFLLEKAQYDFVLCSNVLSAIPCVKTRKSILKAIHGSLSANGRCLFTTQYRNSCFKQMANSPHAEPYLDGWLVKKQRTNSFYGILPKGKLEGILKRNGYSVIESWNSGESAYVLVKKRIKYG